MKFAKTIIAATAMAVAIPAAAQVSASSDRFSPVASGYMERARTMRDAGNYAGVIDQLRHLDTQQVALSPAIAEEFTFLLADAYYQRNDPECLRLLIEFAETYPASPLALQASLAIGDFYFFRHEWPDALEAYNRLDTDRLNRDSRLLYNYRRALCMSRQDITPRPDRLSDPCVTRQAMRTPIGSTTHISTISTVTSHAHTMDSAG